MHLVCVPLISKSSRTVSRNFTEFWGDWGGRGDSSTAALMLSTGLIGSSGLQDIKLIIISE